MTEAARHAAGPGAADEGWEYYRRRVPKAIRRELLTLIIDQDWCQCEMCQLVRARTGDGENTEA